VVREIQDRAHSGAEGGLREGPMPSWFSHHQRHEGHMTLPSIEAILASPGTSFWLKGAIRTALNRDCLDALRDAEPLVAILKRHTDDVTVFGSMPRSSATR
jgi:hypothetical protein